LVRVPSSAGEVEGVTSSAPCVGGVDGSLAVGVAVVEGELLGVGVSVGDGEDAWRKGGEQVFGAPCAAQDGFAVYGAV